MVIHWNAAHRCFHLQTPEMSYVFRVAENGCLIHLYWGEALKSSASLEALLCEQENPNGILSGVDAMPLRYELPTMEPGDFTDPLLLVTHYGLQLHLKGDCDSRMERWAITSIHQ